MDIADSPVEIDSDYAREHVVFIAGGTLSTIDTQICGSLQAGVYVQTIFILQSDAKAQALPRWTSSNTVVQYSYGILTS